MWDLNFDFENYKTKHYTDKQMHDVLKCDDLVVKPTNIPSASL